jgi:YCII-related domain
MMDIDGELRENGELVASDALVDPALATTVRFRNGAPLPTDGPFAEVKESLAGFWIVDVSQERAIEIASRAVAYIEFPMVAGERGGRFGKRSYGADDGVEPSGPQALGEVGQPGAIGFDDEEDGSSVLRLHGGSRGDGDEGAARHSRRRSTAQNQALRRLPDR